MSFMSTNKINIEAVNARAKEAQTPMSTPTELERVVEAILNRNSPIEIADFKGKERIAKEIATYAQTVAEEAVRAKEKGCTLKELEEILPSIGWKIGGRYPNEWIIDNNGKRSNIRVMTDRLEVEKTFEKSHTGSICFFFHSCNIIVIDGDTISIGKDSTFINFYGKALTPLPDKE